MTIRCKYCDLTNNKILNQTNPLYETTEENLGVYFVKDEIEGGFICSNCDSEVLLILEGFEEELEDTLEEV